MRVLIADDEPLARERIRTLLAAEPDIEIVAECADGRSTAASIASLKPDLVFLDIQMPEMDAFGVVNTLGGQVPAIIFVTAYDQFAIRAFEVHAMDYLLKPFDSERFAKALARARRERKVPEHRLVIRTGGRILFLKMSEIDWIEAAGNYVCLHSGSEEYLHRETMSNMESVLDPKQFARIHRSTIVNVDRIKELHPLFRGDYAVTLRNGRRLTLAKAYRSRLSLDR